MAAETPVDQWKTLQKSVHKAISSYFPYEGRARSVVLHDLHFDEKEASHTDIRSQEQAKDLKRTWGVPIYGDIGLVDKATGKEVDRARVRLMTLPKPTNRYSYIVDGSEWQVDNMWRLRSGVYSNVHANGKISTEFNLNKQGDKGGFAGENRLYVPFDPKSKQFKLRYGNSLHTSLYSVLKMLGIPDEQMKKTWGEDVYKANAHDKSEEHIIKFTKALEKRGVKVAGDTYADAAEALTKEFHKTSLLPEATKISLGKSIDTVSGEALLLASAKAHDVAKGALPDDRNSLIFKTLHGTDDFLREKLTGFKTKKAIHAKLANGVDRVMKVRDLISGDLFSKPTKEFFTQSTLSRNPEQVNPLEMICNHRATTIVGDEGGIKNERAIIPSMKVINPSHFGFLDPIHTPESSRTGINLNLPLGVTKVGNEAMVQVYDLKEKKLIKVTAGELHSHHVLLPDQVTIKDGKITPISALVKMKDPANHEITPKPFKEARYLIPSSHQLFDESSNLIPFLQCDQGNRAMMAAKQVPQAVSLAHREKPMVSTQAGDGSSWEKLIGVPWSHSAHVAGTVHAIKTSEHNGYPDAVIIKDAEGNKHEVQIYNHFALNDSKSMIHSTPVVKVGDEVKKGQIIADSNFTKDGHLSLGTNLRVGYMPYKGYNFDDGIVISESAAKKLSSEHLHRDSIEIDPSKDHLSKKMFSAYASTAAKKLTTTQLDKLGADGIIRVGQKVDHGDVLLAAVGKADLGLDAIRAVGRLGKQTLSYKDKSVRWLSDHPGEVVKVVKSPTGKGATVYVKALEPAEIGDKITGRHANKAIITKILPDHEMPRVGGLDGPHLELVVNPAGVPSRINLGQMLETAAGKIAEKTGKPYMVNNFGRESNGNSSEKIRQDLKAAGIPNNGYDSVFDPTSGKILSERVLTGPQYILKLKHQVEKKLAVRSYGSGPGDYSLDQAPKGTGAPHPGQAMGQLEFYAMLAHGARHNLREMATYKADSQIDERMNPQAHTDFWDRVRMGMPLPAPKATFAYHKFEALLKGLGVDIHKEGNVHQLVPLTDKGVLAMSNGEIKDGGRVLRGKDAKELEKGLFDSKITGGLPNAMGKGLHWSHIALAEPLPNPVFVGTLQHPGPAVVLSGLKFQEFEDVVKGKKTIDGKVGGHAINDILKKIDVKATLETSLAELTKARGSARDHLNQKVRYLQALDKLKLKPHEAYVMNHVPVLPPAFRPIVVMPDGNLRYDDINGYYQKLALINNQLKNPIKDLPDAENHKLREQLYDITKAMHGLGGTPVYDSNRKMKGILDVIKGENQPKEGFFQKRLVKRRQELSMRSTIVPEPSMHLDHVGIPKDAAMELYKPFVIRELTHLGYSPLQAMKDMKEGKDVAWKALQNAMDKRPILMKRDPVLHKFGIMAFKPKLVEGRAIQIHPLVTQGYNADFDGDTMSAFVPLTDAAVQESHKMLPSNNLFSPSHGGVMYAPSQEALLGLHLMSKWGDESKKSFDNFSEAHKAHEKGTIKATDVIKVGGEKTTVGRMMIAEKLPLAMRQDPEFTKLLKDPKFIITKKPEKDSPWKVSITNLMDTVAKKHPKEFSNTANSLAHLGNEHAYRTGFSIGMDDLVVNTAMRDKVLDKADIEVAKVNNLKVTQDSKDRKAVEIYAQATTDMNKVFKPHFEKEDNKIFTLVNSGAKGNWDQFRQMNIAPMLVMDGTGKVLAHPIKKSYAEGLDVGDYWTALHGARMGTIQRVQGTSEPGALTKDIINVVIPTMVVDKDCGTTQGISMDIHDQDVHDRFLAAPIKVNGKQVGAAGALITPEMTAMLKKNKVDKVVVRSPLKCQHGNGLCATCYGLNENGHLHEVGVNIGVIAGQSMGEPATQLAMNSFHSGGVAASKGGGSIDKFSRLRQLLGIQQTLPNEATLAKSSGKIDKIEKDVATNGHNIWIGGEKHFSESKRDVLFKVGDAVKKGQAITDGPINPHQLLPLTDIHTVQNYLTDELYHGIYKDERVKRRNIETVVRGLTNLTRVNDPGSSDHLHGDIALRTVVEEHNRNLAAGEHPILHQPMIKGASRTALDQHEDWMARLNFRYLQDTILEGAAQGWKSDLHGLNPIASYAHGANFGKGTPKNPHHY